MIGPGWDTSNLGHFGPETQYPGTHRGESRTGPLQHWGKERKKRKKRKKGKKRKKRRRTKEKEKCTRTRKRRRRRRRRKDDTEDDIGRLNWWLQGVSCFR